MPRPVTLGFAAPAARPGRTVITVIAVLFGAAAVTFGVGLSASLNHVYDDINAGARLPVRVNALPPGTTIAHQSGPGAASTGRPGEGSTPSPSSAPARRG